MRAAVIGTGWGQVHISALQELGVEVVAVCGIDHHRTVNVAERFGVYTALTGSAGVRALPDMNLDLITIAAPTASHASLVATLGPTPLLCEKPAVGVDSPVSGVSQPSGPVWVNYAFAYLDTVAHAETLLTTKNNSQSENFSQDIEVHIESLYDLDPTGSDARNPWQWFTDVASHPWSWAVGTFGQPHGDLLGGASSPPSDPHAWLSYTSSMGALVRVDARRAPGFNGLRHMVTVLCGSDEVSFDGEFRIGGAWRFGPVLHNGQPVSDHGTHPAESGADPWYVANRRAIAAVVARVNEINRSTHAGAGDSGAAVDERVPSTWDQALVLDAAVQLVMGSHT